MTRVVGLVMFCCLIVSATSFADDLNPPPWRGQWSTTVQYWEFYTPEPGPLVPDGPGPLIDDPVGAPYEQPGYLPSTEVIVQPGPGMGWIEFDPNSGREGIWPLSGIIDVVVDNHDPNPENEKWIWVQVTWRPQDAGEVPIFENLDPPPVGDILPIEEIPCDNEWVHSTYFWKLDWNPPDERFTIGGTIDVDELVIDTWCIPEPTILAMFVLGLPLVLKRSRK